MSEIYEHVLESTRIVQNRQELSVNEMELIIYDL